MVAIQRYGNFLKKIITIGSIKKGINKIYTAGYVPLPRPVLIENYNVNVIKIGVGIT